MKQRLLWLDVKVVVTEASEHSSDVITMKCLQFGVHEDVVQIDHHEHVGHILEDVVHKVLKSHWDIGKSHRHDQEFEGAIASPKCCLPLVAGGNVNVVVTGAQVEFGVDAGCPELVNKVRDQWYRVPILSGNLVEVPKVNTEPKGAIFLFGE